MGRRGLRLISLAAIPVLAISACTSSSATPTAAPPASTAPQASTAPESAAPATATTVKWFVGLGSGTQPAQIQAQKDFVTYYNKLNKDGITIKLEIVPNANAYDTLKTEIAAKNAPDIIGPVGVKGRNSFAGIYLDLTAEIASNNFDMSVYDPGLVAFVQQGATGIIGIPYDQYPGYIWYNKDLFTAAGLPNLPTKVGDQYQGKTWDWNELGTIAAQLTVDKNGKKSTEAGFDAKNIVKYGMGFQWHDDLKRIASWFGSGNLVAADGKTAQIPDAWATGLDWWYKGMWTGHYISNSVANGSTLLAGSNLQSSGNIAMNAAFGWSISSIASDAKTSKVKSWDMGVGPAWGTTTSVPMDIDTFAITSATKVPDAAFKAMIAIEADATLMEVYGGEPSKPSDQAAYFASMDATLAPIFPGIQVTWSVLGEDQKQAPAISHEADMPNFNVSNASANATKSKLDSNPGLTVATVLNDLKTKLTADFAAAAK